LFFVIEGIKVSEVYREIPIPVVNYVHLIRKRKSPYYDIVEFLLKDMEMHYSRLGQPSEVVYTINPRILQEEIEKRVKNEKLTTVNVCRTVLALFYGSKLSEEKDFYVTTTSSGRRNYHIKVNNRTLNSLSKFL
jgi:regulator of PEP synthase PpsR (kinase-PPPase family)